MKHSFSRFSRWSSLMSYCWFGPATWFSSCQKYRDPFITPGSKQKRNGEASILLNFRLFLTSNILISSRYWTYLGIFCIMTLTSRFEIYSLRLKYSYESKIVIDFVKLLSAVVIFVLLAQKKLMTIMKRYDTMNNAARIWSLFYFSLWIHEQINKNSPDMFLQTFQKARKAYYLKTKYSLEFSYYWRRITINPMNIWMNWKYEKATENFDVFLHKVEAMPKARGITFWSLLVEGY